MSWTFDITVSVEQRCLVLTRWAKYILDKIYVGQEGCYHCSTYTIVTIIINNYVQVAAVIKYS